MIGIIGAMDKEMTELTAMVGNPETKYLGGIKYTVGTLAGKDIVVATCGVGKVFAAMCAQTMALFFHPELIINTGVAGTLSDKLHIGDVVISTSLVQYDIDTTAIGDPLGLISGPNIIYVDADPSARRLMAECCGELDMRCTEGLIASGELFVHTPEQRQHILDNFDAIACEMEGGAIAQVCYTNKIPFVITRAISDGADDGAGMDYPTFVHFAIGRSVRLVDLFIKRYGSV